MTCGVTSITGRRGRWTRPSCSCAKSWAISARTRSRSRRCMPWGIGGRMGSRLALPCRRLSVRRCLSPFSIASLVNERHLNVTKEKAGSIDSLIEHRSLFNCRVELRAGSTFNSSEFTNPRLGEILCIMEHLKNGLWP